MRYLVRTCLFLLVGPAAQAGSVLDYIRNYDLNDYALGVSYSVSDSPYVGGVNSGFAYPYLTSFRHNAFTKDWLILSNGDMGFRWSNDAGWVLGAVGRIRTQGTGSSALEELLDLDSRSWLVEVAPLVGWRGWPVHLEAKQYDEVFSSHAGPTAELMASYPIEFDRGWFVPSVALVRNSADFNRYYYGVDEDEVLPGRPAYTPGSSDNLRARLSVGYAITERWLLSVSASYEWLDSPITDSPIVDKDTLWSGNVGIAYNNDIFRSREYAGDSFSLPGLELRAGLYSNTIDSKIRRLPVDGGPGEEIDMEDLLGVDRSNKVLQADAIYRFAFFHRVQIGYFKLGRESRTTTLADLIVGDVTIPEGTEIDVSADLKVARLSYGFSLMNDPQKELGVSIGLHFTRYKAVVTSRDNGDAIESKINAPLPVIGVFGSLALGEDTDLSAAIEIFRMEFDHYDGSLSVLYLGLKHHFTSKIGAGIGYNLYAMNLDSPDEELRGSLRLRHHGPTVFMSFRF